MFLVSELWEEDSTCWFSKPVFYFKRMLLSPEWYTYHVHIQAGAEPSDTFQNELFPCIGVELGIGDGMCTPRRT